MQKHSPRRGAAAVGELLNRYNGASACSSGQAPEVQ